MTGVHLHLLINHAPVLGSIFALVLLVASFLWAPDVLRRTALAVLIATGVTAAVANYTGEPAEHAIEGLPGVRRELIHDHEEIGEKAFYVAAVVGVLAIGALLRWRRATMPRGAALGALASAAVVSGMMAYTALLGGRLRHTEVRPGATEADATVIEPRRVRGPRPPEGER